ncbi:MAG: pyroglutamyl-peptidase I [Mycoplasmatales bacterium]
MKILVTGFDPFGTDTINPAIEAVKLLNDEILGCKIIKLEIPTVHKKSVDIIKKAMIKHKPDVVLSIGQAGNRTDVSIERIAINIDDYRILDNENNQPIDETIVEGAPSAYFTNLPIKAMVKHIRESDVPVSVSNTAGTFVCNHVMYGVLHLCATKFPSVKSGFIHIPFLPNQVIQRPATASMSLDLIVLGLTKAIEGIILNPKDIKLECGQTH